MDNGGKYMANKEEIVTKIAENSGFTKKQTYKFMDAFVQVLIETLRADERFHIHKIFTMEPIHKDACITRNPRTQEEMELSARTKVKTVIGTKLYESLNVEGE